MLKPLSEKTFSLHERYERLVIISNLAHLLKLDIHDSSTLIVASNWLVWQKAVAKGWHCVHFQYFWDSTQHKNLVTDLFLRSNDWVYYKEKDITEFHGVSLGRKFTRQISQVIVESVKIQTSIEYLIVRFKINKILYIDMTFLPCTKAILNSRDQLAIIKRLGENHGIVVEPKTGGLLIKENSSKSLISTASTFISYLKTIKSSINIKIFQVLVCFVRTLYFLFGKSSPKKRKILLLLSHLNGIKLLEQIPLMDFQPLYLSSWHPNKKNIFKLIRQVFQGLETVRIDPVRLNKKDQIKIHKICHNIKKLIHKPQYCWHDDVHQYILENLTNGQKISDAAKVILGCEAILKRHKPDAIFTDALQNPLCMTFLELAKKNKMKTFITWHGPYYDDILMEVFGCDSRTSFYVDHCLTWGAQFETYLKNISSISTYTRSGSLISETIPNMTVPDKDINSPLNILILPYHVAYHDISWPHDAQFNIFVDTVKTLKKHLPNARLKLKIHPGLSLVEYYSEITKFYNIDCDIHEDGPFLDYLQWSDITIGSVHTGAMLEVMASGKPYYPLLFNPTSVNIEHLKGCEYFQNITCLVEAISKNIKPNYHVFLNRMIDTNNETKASINTITALERQIVNN